MSAEEQRSSVLKDVADSLLKVDGRLSPYRLALWIVAAAAGIALLFVFEDRATLVPRLFSSPWVIGIVSGIAVLGVFGTIGGHLFGRVEATNTELQNFMRGQIAEMREEAKLERAHSMRQDIAIEALQTRDRQCQEDLRHVRTRMTRYEQIIARAGLDFGDSTT